MSFDLWSLSRLSSVDEGFEPSNLFIVRLTYRQLDNRITVIEFRIKTKIDSKVRVEPITVKYKRKHLVRMLKKISLKYLIGTTAASVD